MQGFKPRSETNKLKENQKTEAEIKFETPLEIKNLIDLLIAQNELELKFYYSDWFIEDASDVHFVINHKGISKNVGIGILLKEVQNQNESEKLIFLLEKELKKLREEMYQKMLLAE